MKFEMHINTRINVPDEKKPNIGKKSMHMNLREYGTICKQFSNMFFLLSCKWQNKLTKIIVRFRFCEREVTRQCQYLKVPLTNFHRIFGKWETTLCRVDRIGWDKRVIISENIGFLVLKLRKIIDDIHELSNRYRFSISSSFFFVILHFRLHFSLSFFTSIKNVPTEW